MIKKTKKPRFHRQNSQVKKRSGNRWRKPRGMDSKQREGFKSRGTKPTVGYRQPKKIRGKHPSGYEEILIKNTKQLEGINKEKQAIKISSTVGAKKKTEIIKKAEEKKIKILNPKINKKKKIAKKKTKKAEEKKKEETKKTEPKKETIKEQKKEENKEKPAKKEDKKETKEVKGA